MVMWKLFQATGIALLVTVAFHVTTGMWNFAADCEDIRENVLRLHVLANSDEVQDQTLKLQVRDRILSECGALFEQLQSKQQAKQVTAEWLGELQRVAQAEVTARGYDSPVDVELVNMFFDHRAYDTLELPAGRYDALRVTIGKAEGKNWWCIVYPALCLPASEVNQQTEVLETILGEHGAELVTNAENYKVEFAVVEMFEKIKNLFVNQA